MTRYDLSKLAGHLDIPLEIEVAPHAVYLRPEGTGWLSMVLYRECYGDSSPLKDIEADARLFAEARNLKQALIESYAENDRLKEENWSSAKKYNTVCGENDRLRSLLPVWTTYDGTPETLPPVGSKLYQISAYHHEFMGFRESETTWGEIWGGGYRLWSISIGERWAPAMYDPDPPKYRKVEEGEVQS